MQIVVPDRWRRWLVWVFAIAMLFAIPLPTGASQDVASFPALQAGVRVYDETGSSLTSEQTANLNEQIADLQAIGTDVIVYVRALDASPEETLDQVEALQQSWVDLTGTNQDNAVAILINRNPNDPNDARAGIYVGSTYDDGNVPRDEQEAIVDDALIPPLRDGDVYGSLSAALDRLESSIINGPPRNGFQRFADGFSDGWLPWAGAGIAIAGLAGGIGLFSQRERGTVQPPAPTTDRPGDLPPAVVGVLTGSTSAKLTGFSATLLDLATRGALSIEPEDEGGMFSQPKVRVHLQDESKITEEVDIVVWSTLVKYAEDGVVSSKDLQRASRITGDLSKAVEQRLKTEGWTAESAVAPRNTLAGLCLLALVLTIGLIAVTAGVTDMGNRGMVIIPMVALGALTIVLFCLCATYSPLSWQGQNAAAPWIAYGRGIKAAGKGENSTLDLNTVLPDAVAMNLTGALKKPLKAAEEAGQPLRAFSGIQASTLPRSSMIFPYWTAYSSSVHTTSSGSSSTVSGGGSGGGGGAAGST